VPCTTAERSSAVARLSTVTPHAARADSMPVSSRPTSSTFSSGSAKRCVDAPR
jgi:hypothetical protein